MYFANHCRVFVFLRAALLVAFIASQAGIVTEDAEPEPGAGSLSHVDPKKQPSNRKQPWGFTRYYINSWFLGMEL